MTYNVAQLAQELYRRRQARNSVIEFAEFIDVPGRPSREDDEYDEDEDEADDADYLNVESQLAEHHKMILREAVECFEKDYGRLMIFMPPGAAKSTYASVVVPAYLMGCKKKTRIGLFSYGSGLAKKFGRRTRSIIRQARYASIMQFKKKDDPNSYPVCLSSDSSAANEFTLTNGSEYMSTGILGAATGNRFNFMVIDDPVKGREDADSETIRDKTWDAYEDDLKTRLIPGGSIMVIQTRWHEDDLSGRILPDDWNGESGDIECKDGNTWRVLCLQAECATDTDPLGRKRGDMFWPEWFTEKHWAQFRSNSRTWGALCQQLPRPADGNMFKPDKIEIIDALPAGYIKWVRGWDLAATEGGGKYTAGVRLGVHRESGKLVIHPHIVHGQWGPGNRDEHMRLCAVEDGRTVTQDIPDDPGAGGTAQTEYIVKKLRGYPVVFGPESGDKGTRAMPVAAEVNVGNVMMVRNDLVRTFKEELRSFPNGTYTDLGDALSRAYARLFPTEGKITINKQLVNRLRRG